MDAITNIFAALAVGVAYIVYRLLSKATSRRGLAPLPPGPRPLPLIGNLVDLPKSHAWLTFSKWGDIYGGIVHVSALGQSIVILNDPKYAVEMLDKKGLLYSDRPKLVMGGQMVGWEEAPVLSPFCDRWAEYRRLMSQFMGTKAKIDELNHVLQEETNVLLKQIIADPHDWVEHVRSFSGGLVLQLVYGYRASDPGGKELVKLVDDAMHGFSRQAKEFRGYLQGMLHVPFELVKKQMATSVARPSFTRNLLERSDLSPQRERIIQWAAAGIYSGGAETTVAAISAFVLGITRHPKEREQAQAEIDAVIGRDRLPTPADRERLPYCHALYLEVIRCYTLGPLGLPHVARGDDVHDGYFIPKGSIVIPNNWRYFHDPHTYPHPEAFSPERFLGAEKQFDPRKYVFGYGRRVCPGLHLGDATMWLASISILAAFDVTPPVKDGQPIIPPGDFQDAMISHPEPFECVIRPRSASAEAVVHGLPSMV
ncbi:cytochrome P450 [Earliella scabrosa]|nr:cytochrome P450 [Earliella scabrosa]